MTVLGTRLSNGDSRAVEDVYQALGPRVLSYLRRRVPYDEAEDVLQRVFFEVWRSRERYDPDRSLEAWVFAIARKRAIDHLRRPHHVTVPIDLVRDLAGADGREDADNLVWAREVRRGLDRLAAEQREVLELAYFGGGPRSRSRASLGYHPQRQGPPGSGSRGGRRRGCPGRPTPPGGPEHGSAGPAAPALDRPGRRPRPCPGRGGGPGLDRATAPRPVRRHRPAGRVGAVAASGQASMAGDDGDRRMTVTTDDLPALRPGQYYEVWLLDPKAGRVFPVGVLPSDGEARFTLPASVVGRYQAIDVSLEADDGDPTHSKHSLLRGRYA